MGLVIKPQEENLYIGEKPLIDAGSYPARCIRIIDLGTQEVTFKGEKKEKHLVKFVFETPDELAKFSEDNPEEPFVLSKTYTASFNTKASLYKDLVSWLKQDVRKLPSFALTDLLGKECLVSVSHSESETKKRYLSEKCKESGIDTAKIHPSQYTYANIVSIMPVPKGMEVSKSVNEEYCLDFDNFDEAVYDKLSKYDKEKVDSSLERSVKQEASTQDTVSEEDVAKMFS